MKTLITILAILFAFGAAKGQETILDGTSGEAGTISLAGATSGKITYHDEPTKMKAVKVETSIDFKYERMSNYIKEMTEQVGIMMANETISGECKKEQLTIDMLKEIQAISKAYRPRFIEAVQSAIEVDSLAYIEEQVNDNKELNRLKAAINLGKDSTILQPRANAIKNRINERNKIIRTWKKIDTLN